MIFKGKATYRVAPLVGDPYVIKCQGIQVTSFDAVIYKDGILQCHLRAMGLEPEEYEDLTPGNFGIEIPVGGWIVYYALNPNIGQEALP